MQRRLMAAVLAATGALALGAVGCGDDDSSSSGGSSGSNALVKPPEGIKAR